MEARQLLNRGMFTQLPQRELVTLARACTTKAYDADQVIVRAGLPQKALVFLAAGRAMIYRRNAKEGVSLLLGVVEPPTLFGDAEWAAGTAWMSSMRAVESSWCVMIPLEVFSATLERNRDVCLDLYKDASRRHLQANLTAVTMALYPMDSRLVRLLLSLSAPPADDQNTLTTRPVSQVELAASLGVNRRTIARTLEKLEADGLAARRGSSFELTLNDQLRQLIPDGMLGIGSRLGDQPSPLLEKPSSYEE